MSTVDSLSRHRRNRERHSFPTRRSSDLLEIECSRRAPAALLHAVLGPAAERDALVRNIRDLPDELDRKSTRLNSSHLGISYAVFCLKKKKKQNTYSSYNSKATPQAIKTE